MGILALQYTFQLYSCIVNYTNFISIKQLYVESPIIDNQLCTITQRTNILLYLSPPFCQVRQSPMYFSFLLSWKL